MNRTIATALASAALVASVSVSAALAGAQSTQVEQPAPKIERTGQKQKKVVQASCPVHPEEKARPGKCPKCRAEERPQKEAQQRGQKVRQRPQPPQPQQEGEASNE